MEHPFSKKVAGATALIGAALLHYNDGKLAAVPPFTADSTSALQVNHISGTTQQLVTGFTFSATKAYAEVFQGG